MKVRADFLYHLQRQLGFIDTSCRQFDDGNLDEAIRIAVAIRILLYDTGRSTSLLTHVGAKGTVQLLSSVNENRLHEPPGMTRIVELPLGGLRMSAGGVGHRASLSPGVAHAHVSVDKWCKQTAYRNGPNTALTRMELVLAAAHKDGGAHVDAEDVVEYARLARDAFSGFLRLINPDETTKNMHLRFLRVLGEEIICSPGLHNL